MTQREIGARHVICTDRTTAQQAYSAAGRLAIKTAPGRQRARQTLSCMPARTTSGDPIGRGLLGGGPTSYRHARSGALVARLISNPLSAWYASGGQLASDG